MRWHEIMEEASAGATASGNIATVSFPMTPGTTKKQQRQAVDPMGHTVNKSKPKKKSQSAYKIEVDAFTGQPIKR